MIYRSCLALAVLALAMHAGALLSEPAASPPDVALAPAATESTARHEGHADDAIKLTQTQITASDIAVAPAGGGVLSRRITVPGTITLDPGRVARAPARVDGTVAELRKRLGDVVAKDEIVAILDSREAADVKTDFLTAAVDYELKKTLFERTKALWNKKFAPEQQHIQAEAAYAEARLRLDLARQKLTALHLDPAEVATAAREDAEKSGPSRLREYPVRSPISGRVIEAKVDVGTAVGADGEPDDLYTIADVSKLWIELAVPTAELDTIMEGQKVEIVREGVGRARQSGRIIFVSPMLDPQTRSARVIAEIANDGGMWRPGTFVTTTIILGDEPLALRLPRGALQRIQGESVVFVRTEDGFERRDVTIGRQDAETVEVVDGLSPGEPVAVKNTFLLKAELGKSVADDAHHH